LQRRQDTVHVTRDGRARDDGETMLAVPVGGQVDVAGLVGHGDAAELRELAVEPELRLAEGAQVDVIALRGGFALVTPASGEGTEAWFAGSLASLTVPEVIQFIFTTLKSGTLILSFGADARRAAEDGAGARPHRRTLYFHEGQVVFASSSDPADRLGAVLWRQGIVPQEELERCGKLIRSGRQLGQILVDERILTSGQLYEAITIQVKEIVLASCLEQEGEFAFIEGPFDETNSVKLDERTRERTSSKEAWLALSFPSLTTTRARRVCDPRSRYASPSRTPSQIAVRPSDPSAPNTALRRTSGLLVKGRSGGSTGVTSSPTTSANTSSSGRPVSAKRPTA